MEREFLARGQRGGIRQVAKSASGPFQTRVRRTPRCLVQQVADRAVTWTFRFTSTQQAHARCVLARVDEHRSNKRQPVGKSRASSFLKQLRTFRQASVQMPGIG